MFLQNWPRYGLREAESRTWERSVGGPGWSAAGSLHGAQETRGPPRMRGALS